MSSLVVLRQLMEMIKPEDPPKPCDYFDMIGGTSTGGLIAIMLGRLRMTVDECIDEYLKLSPRIFTHVRHRVRWPNPIHLAKAEVEIQGRFDHDALEQGIKDLLVRRGLKKDELLKESSDSASCKV